MIYVVYVIVLLLNLIAAIRRKKNKILLLFSIVLMVLIWTGNTVGPDINNYLTQYRFASARLLQNGNIEIIYNQVMNWFSSHDFSFYVYRFVVCFLAFVTILFGINKVGANLHVVFFLYILSQFFLDGIQIRNFLTLPFLMFALVALIRQDKAWRSKYAVLIIIASMIHSSFLVYLVFLLIPNEKRDSNKTIRIHVAIAVSLCLVFFTARKYISILVNLISSISADKATSYSLTSTNLGPLICIALQIAGIFFSYYMYQKLKCLEDYYQEDNNFNIDCIWLKRIFWINIFGMYLLPFSLVQLTFYRLIRNLLLINFASVGVINKYYRRNLAIFIISIAYLILWQVSEFSILNEFDVIVLPFFKNNMFFNW